MAPRPCAPDPGDKSSTRPIAGLDSRRHHRRATAQFQILEYRIPTEAVSNADNPQPPLCAESPTAAFRTRAGLLDCAVRWRFVPRERGIGEFFSKSLELLRSPGGGQRHLQGGIKGIICVTAAALVDQIPVDLH